jgi:RNA polymerase sigma factor (sigma-70 family)
MDQADKGGPQTESNPDKPSRHVHSAGDLVQRLLDHESAFRHFLRRRISDEALVEDLLQQSFVRAVEHQHSLRNDDSVVAWFYRVLRNTVIDYYRSHGAESRRDEAFLQELTQLEEDKEPPLDEMKATVCQCLYGIMPALRSNYSELLRRIDLECESPAHVAHDLNITLNNLTVRLHRARQALRAGLEQSCGVCSQHGCLNCSCE